MAFQETTWNFFFTILQVESINEFCYNFLSLYYEKRGVVMKM